MRLRWFVLLWFVLFLSGPRAHAADGPYAVASIPPALLVKANAVVRLEETTFDVQSVGEAIHKYHLVVTILNEKGNRHAIFTAAYDKLIKLTSLRGAIYDAAGRQIKKFNKNDAEDRASYDGYSIASDDRYKLLDLRQVNYPYTVEYEYERLDRNLLGYPSWNPQDVKDITHQRSSLTVRTPLDLKLRYKEINVPQPVRITEEAGKRMYFWEATNVPILELERDGTTIQALYAAVIRVRIAPTDFEVEGYRGNMSTWQGLGAWENQLLRGRDQLPEELRQKLVHLTADAKEPVEKIRRVYEYLQASTRYVSIQLGIGGWQPFEAASVYKNGYGDCKALSNYTKAMLKAIGIESHYASVLAGDDKPDIQTDFPSSQFNHVILCVPLPKDTVWLECTNQTNPFGYMGSFTGNRHALILTPDGGKLVRTPTYRAQDNRQTRTATVLLDPTGDATATVQGVYTGLRHDDRSDALNNLSPDEQKKWLYKHTDIPAFDINSFSLTEQKDRLPSVTERMQLTVRKCASVSGKRVFLPLNLLSVASSSLTKADNRRTALTLSMPFEDSDTIRYQLPAGYAVESLPTAVAFASPFGTYAAAVAVDKDAMFYTRQHRENGGTYPAAAYNAYVDFRKKIAKADKMQLVLVSNVVAEK